jgi:membrane peptidoglycan carboxypeptidase
VQHPNLANQNKDAWMVGFTPAVSTAVWVGTDTSEPIKNAQGRPVFGRMLPGSIWQTFMNAAVRGTPPEQFSPFDPLGVPPGPPPAQAGDSQDCKSDDSDSSDSSDDSDKKSDDCDSKDSDKKSDDDSDKKSDSDSDKKRDGDSDSSSGDSDRSDNRRDKSDKSDDGDSSDEGAAFTSPVDPRLGFPSSPSGDGVPVLRAAHTRPAPGQ